MFKLNSLIKLFSSTNSSRVNKQRFKQPDVNFKLNKVDRLKNRVSKDLERGDVRKAISRCEGFLNYNFTDLDIQFLLAELHLKNGDKIKAGRYLFFKSHQSEKEKLLLEGFQESVGNSPTAILKLVLPKEHFRVKELNISSKKNLIKFVKASIEECGCVPNFLSGINRYLLKHPEYNQIT